MGRMWCQTDPTIHVNRRPVHIRLLAPIDILGRVSIVRLTVVVPGDAEIAIPLGQAERTVFGVQYELERREVGEDGRQYVIAEVFADESWPILGETKGTGKDNSWDLFGIGSTNEELAIDMEVQK